MENKLVKNLALLFGLVLIGATWFVWRGRDFGEGQNLVGVGANLNNFNYESVEKFIFKGGEGQDEKVFELKEGKWYLNGEEADSVKMEAFWNKFDQFYLMRLVTKDAEKHLIFQVDRDHAAQLIFYDGAAKEIFYLGKDDVPGTFYIRKNGVANVYLANSMIKSDLTQPAEYFKKKDSVMDDSADVPAQAESE